VRSAALLLVATALLASCEGRLSAPVLLEPPPPPPVIVDAGDPADAGPTAARDAGPTDAGDASAPDAGFGIPVFVNSWGGRGTAPGLFIEPSSVELDGNGVVIVAGHENRVQRFLYDGSPVEIWGEAGTGDGQFNHPHGLAVDHDRGLVYVGDQENHRLQVFDLDGAFIRQWGDALFAHIHDVGIDRETGDVFVGDLDLDILRKFSSTGELLGQYGGTGIGPGQFNGVWGMSTDSDRNLYVSDTHNDRVQKLAVTGAPLDVWTDWDGISFLKPTGVFVDSDDVVYVCDSLAEMVYVFDTDGNPLERWDLAEIYGERSEPEDIVISADGHDIFIGEVAGHRVLHLAR
jgi:DNA-binding beta-propeller fold protein YncE